MVLVAEPMQGLESAAFSFLVPAGTIYEHPSQLGTSSLLCDMLLRGCGPRDSRKFLADLEILGVQRGESVTSAHVSFGGATVAENLPATLDIYADLLRRPHLNPEHLPAAQQVILQELRAIEDDPGHKTLLELRRRHYPDPWGRNSEGSIPTIEAAGMAQVKSHFQRYIRPNGTILGVAGKIDWAAVTRSSRALVWRLETDGGARDCFRRLANQAATHHSRFSTNPNRLGLR